MRACTSSQQRKAFVVRERLDKNQTQRLGGKGVDAVQNRLLLQNEHFKK